MIDLHLHTTASDGRSTPADLVAEAAGAGLTTIAVTDHDTVAAHREVETLAGPAGIRVVRGIEISAVHQGRDVHILGYFVDAADAGFLTFLAAQREDRRRRVREIGARLAALGVSLDIDRLLEAERSRSGWAIGRPALAQALMEAGHVASFAEAFDRFLGQGQPAFVPRRGPSPHDAIRHLARIGAIAAIAHPGKTRCDELIEDLAQAGMAALEVFHPDHAEADVERYSRRAAELGLLRTGGSDYHGAGSGRSEALGRVTLPPADFSALAAHAARMRR